MGPTRSQESAGASRKVVSAKESGICGESGESASALQNAGEARACSNVANGPSAAELIDLVDAAIVALDAGETEVARAQLQALAEAVRPWGTPLGKMAFDRCDGEERTG